MTAKLDIDLRFTAAPLTMFEADVKKQIPFATAVALTRTTMEVRGQVRESLPRYFTVRATWISRGIQMTRATKSRLVAEVGSRDEFMERQVYGGTKEPAGGKLIAVPREIRKTKAQKTTKSRWPGAVLRRKNHYTAPLPSGDIGVFHQTRQGEKLLYVLTKRVEVEPRWPFFDIAWDVVKREWPEQQVKAMLLALKGR